LPTFHSNATTAQQTNAPDQALHPIGTAFDIMA